MLKSGRNNGMHMEGVTLLLGRRVQKSLTGWEPHSSRILRASFLTNNKRIKMNIVVIYAPTNDAEDQDKVDFYNELQDIVEKLPRRDINIIMGYANAKIGESNVGFEEVMGKFGEDLMNNNGEKFANMGFFK